jgi:uncharacterized protein YecE (DUF72 family)
MRLHVGTSGFSYKAWKGSFYPEDLPAKDMLAYYASRLSTVEVNNTFYKSPVRAQLERWAEVVPESFVFVLKAPQRITHGAKLLDVEEPVERLWQAAQGLGARLGPILFQLPPFLRKDLERLHAFLAALPAGLVPVLEFRHASWNDEETHACLREHRAALCLADTDEPPATEPVGTARHGYLRLRRVDYAPRDLDQWAERIRRQAWDDVFVFFKHEDEGTAPRLALELRRAFDARA